jgi:predicted 2-oxoglutarate/Fe(II)-dependent dioxygenase YbiX
MYLEVHKKVFDSELCEEIYQILSHENFKKATLNKEISNLRQGQDVKLSNPIYFQKLFPIIESLMPAVYCSKKFIGLDTNSCYALSYFKGQFFDVHRDGYSYDMMGNKSLLTIQVYLTDTIDDNEELTDPERICIGGRTTIFNDSGKIINNHKFARGDIIIFDHRYLHCGSEVKDGTKITLRINALYDSIEINSYQEGKRVRDINLIKHSLMYPVVTFEYTQVKTKQNQGRSHAMDPKYDLCTNCNSFTLWDNERCSYCCSKISLKRDEILKKRKYGFFIPQ